MKTITPLVLLITLFFSTAASAGSNSTQTPNGTPIGEWVIDAILSNGDKISVRTTITANFEFSGTKYINGKHNWSYAGTWSMSEQALTYIYHQSSIPSLVGFVDVDVVLQVDEFVFKFRAVNGEVYTYIRVQ
jgi:hypothetical protein